MTTPSTLESRGEEHIYLLARTPLKEFTKFRSTEPVDGQEADMKKAAELWRAADNHIRSLQFTEAKWADNPDVKPVTPAMEPLIAHVKADPIFQRAFTAVPVGIGLVALDQLVVYQKTINLVHVRALKERLGPDPDPAEVYRTCLPYDHPLPKHRAAYLSGNSYVVVSESTDLRFLESVILRPDQVTGHRSLGPMAAVVSLVVGYGSNYLNVISTEGRMVLNNGNHRAYALRDLGLTHVPCIIQRVTNSDEFKAVSAGALRRTPDVYVRQPRPPVLKDYFDPKLRAVVHLTPRSRQVRVSFTVEELFIPEAR